MKCFSYAFTVIFLLFTVITNAQEFNQTLRGSVRDGDTQQLMEGVSVQLEGSDKGAVSDSLGNFRIENIPIGKYSLKLSFVGYKTVELSPVILESGKETVLDFVMVEATSVLGTAVIRAPGSNYRTNCPTVHTITTEETLRYPATFDDPARYIMSQPGIAGDNDQGNGLSVRGNSPNGILWQLEGLEIVNPNHTPNAGTFSDRITQNGGGVNILSVQLLDASNFYAGAFPVEFGNALSGVMDMKLRNGNNQKHEFTGQAGLIGIEMASEGPLPTKGASYLVNYRYSTVSLLQKMGLDFGNESINFQDVSFKVSLPLGNAGQLAVFGIGGVSENLFEAERDSSLWEFTKDGFDIDFGSRMGLLGSTLSMPVGDKGAWDSGISFSGLEATRYGRELNEDYESVLKEKNETTQTILAFRNTYTYKIGMGNRIRAGLNLTNHYSKIVSGIEDQVIGFGKGSGLMIQPYLDWQIRRKAWILNAGLHYTQFTFNGSGALEPRFSLEWRPADRSSLSFSYGLHSQMQRPQIYFTNSSLADNQQLELSKAHHFVAAYRQVFGNNLEFRSEVYYQNLFDLPVSADRESAFSAYNILEGFVGEKLTNDGTATNYGLEFSLRKYYFHNFYYMINASLYESKYKGSDGVERNTRYNGNYIFNGIVGKDWEWNSKKGSKNKFGVNVRLNLLGGFRDTPIDEVLSTAAGETVYIESASFSIKQKDYFRTDIRIYFQRDKKNFTSRISLDLQNALNTQNTAYSYYDIRQKTVVLRNQLGLIPMLSYRVKF